MVLTVLYSLAGLGIAIVNDFKSIEGDRAMGLQSLPVAFGVDTAKWICVGTIDVTQLGVAAYLQFGLHQTTYAAVLLGLILPQVRLVWRPGGGRGRGSGARACRLPFGAAGAARSASNQAPPSLSPAATP
jgi:4-hydroxybenzoate polyprenyltransferase